MFSLYWKIGSTNVALEMYVSYKFSSKFGQYFYLIIDRYLMYLVFYRLVLTQFCLQLLQEFKRGGSAGTILQQI